MTRITIDDNLGHLLHGFMLYFAGTAPRDLVGKPVFGSFVALGEPVVSMTPWGIAERRMRDMFAPFTSP